MADQQRKVSLIFEANTNQAKQSINDLITTLQKIQSMPTSIIDPTGIREAGKAAMELQGHLQRAVNVDTGKLDLTRFAASTGNAENALNNLRTTLANIGPVGNSAFQQVLRSINSAEVSTVRLTKGMRDFLVTMKNTVKWQISSSIMHNLIGTIQQAHGYAKALDASLNNIRIVTGQTADQMARFAVEANRSAQALSTTTTKYTEAALIFYQQGLSDQAVRERTEAVIKMANVTGEAAKDVSSYMTAIWNNFDDGSKSLEYYADVITKLGAATAASSEEIAGGLEKFAAIADTIGLSYEYATSMITTIVDKTRQSEDVVGTALKTILARVQGLNLGETLEDGTTLNKYSSALAKVGVNIKDASGQLKDMDIILDELGSKWGTFSKDTQIALAQVVGGVRQYNQIIALMDNWQAFKSNVNLAETSTGSLTEQSDIYAEGWEAARNRVKAAAEGIYDALLDEKVFIQLDNIFTGLLTSIGGVVKGMGGMIPILSTIGGLMAQKYAKEMPTYFNSMAQNLAIFSGKAHNTALDTQRQVTAQATEKINSLSGTGDEVGIAQYDAIKRVSIMKEKLLANQQQMSAEEIKSYNLLIQNEEAMGDILVKRQESLKALTQETEELKKQALLESAKEQRQNHENGRETSTLWKDTYETEKEKFEKELAEADDAFWNKEDITEDERQVHFSRFDKYGYGQGSNSRSDAYYEELTRRTEESVAKNKLLDTAYDNLVDVSGIQKQKEVLKNELSTFIDGDTFKESENKVEVFKEKVASISTALQGLELTDGSKQKLQAYADVIADLGSDADISEDMVKQLIEIMKTIDDDAKNAVENTRKAFTDLGGSAEKATEAIQLGIKKGAANSLKPMGTKKDDTPDPSKSDLSSKASKVATSMGTLMSTWSAFNSIMSTSKVLMDENASGLEKIGSVVGMLMTTTMAFNSIVQLGNTLKLKEKLISYALTGAKVKEVTVTKLLSATTKKLANDIKALFASMGPLGWAITAVTVAATIFAGVMGYLSSRETEAEKKTRLLKERTEGLKAAQEDLSTRVQQIGEDFNAYDEAVKTLESCTEGTLAWYEALDKVNTTINNILSSHPALSKYARWDSQGNFYWAEGYEEEKERLERASQITDTAYALKQYETVGTYTSTGLTYSELKKIQEYLRENSPNGISGLGSLEAFMGWFFSESGMSGDDRATKGVLRGLGLSEEEAQSWIDNHMMSSDYQAGSYYNLFSTLTADDRTISKALYGNEMASNKSAEVRAVNATNALFSGVEGYDFKNTGIYIPIFNREIDKIYEEVEGLTEEVLLDEFESYSGITGLRYDEDTKTYVNALGASYTKQGIESEVVSNRALEMPEKIVEEVDENLDNSTAFGAQLARANGDFSKIGLLSTNLLKYTGDDPLAAQSRLYGAILRVNPYDFSQERWEEIKEFYGLSGETPLEALEYTNQGIEEARASFYEKWANIYGNTYGNIGDFNVLSKFLSSDSRFSALGAGLNNNYSEERLTSLMTMLNDIENNTPEAYDSFNALVTDIINSGADYDSSMDVINKAREQIFSQGRKLKASDVQALVDEYNIDLSSWGISIEDLTDVLNNSVNAAVLAKGAFAELNSTLSVIKKSLSNVTEGTTFDEKTWGEVKDYIPKDYADKFLETAEGGAVFIGTDEEGKALTQTLNQQAGEEYYNNVLGVRDKLEEFKSNSENLAAVTDKNGEVTQESVIAGIESSDIENFLPLAEALGFSEEDFVPGTDKYNDLIQALVDALSGDFISEEKVSQRLATQGADRATVERWREQGLFTSDDHYQYAGTQAIKADYEKFDVSSEDIETQIELLKKYEDVSELSKIEVTELAAAQVRFNRGISNGRNGIKDWISDLKKGEEACEDWEGTLGELNDVYSDLLNLDTDALPQTFLESEENAKLLEKALNGDKEAFNQLQAAAAKADFLEESKLTEIPERAEEVIEKVASLGEDIPIGITITGDLAAQLDAEYLKAYNAARAGGADVTAAMEAANAAMEAAGFNVPQMEVVESDITGEIPDGWEPQENGSVIQTMPDGSTQEVVGVRAVKTEGGTYHYKQTTLRPVGEGGWKKKNESIGGGRSSGGGGGGGGRRTAGKAKKDSEKERYHSIKNVIEDLTAAYEKITTVKDRAFGKSRVKAMKEEEAALQALMAAQQDYISEIETYLQEDFDALTQLSEFAGVTLEFDENGTLLNFDQLQDAMWEQYNSHIQDGKVVGMSDDEWKDYQEQWQAMMDLLTQYEETQDLIAEARQKLQEYINQIYDLRLEEVTYMVRVDIEASDDALKILDYLLKQIKDDAWSAAEAIAYMGQQAATSLDKNNTYTSGITDILMNHTQDIVDANGNVVHAADLTVADVQGFMNGDQAAIDKILGMGDNFTEAEIESLRKYYQQLLETNQAMIDLRKSVHETVLNSFTKFNEELGKSIDLMEHLSKVTEHYRNIVDIVGKQNLGISNEMLLAAGQASVGMDVNRVSAARTRKETLENQLAQAQAALERARAAGLEEDAKQWEKTIEGMRKKLEEAEQDFLQSWEDALTAINEQFELAISSAIETFSDQLAGPLMGSLEQLQDAFERQGTITSLYLPNYEKIYELNKLNRDILKSMDDTDSIKAKQELAALQAEINALEAEGVEVSKYQTEDLRRRYELKLAEIALTDAQNAKSQVQMARGADGNWSYVYTANEEDVAAAEQNYEDKLFAIQQANAQYINDMQSSLIQTQTELSAKIEEIMADETISAEEKMARVNEITEYYVTLFNYYSGQLNLGLENNSQQFHETALATLTGFQTIEEYQQNLNNAIGDGETGGMLYELAQAYSTWQANVEEAMAAAGTTTLDYANTMAEAVNSASEASQEAADQIVEDSEDIVDAFTDIIEAVEAWEAQYSEVIDNMLLKNQALAESFNQILQAWSDYTSATQDDPSDSPTTGNNGSGPEASGEGEEGSEENQGGGIGKLTVHRGTMNIRSGPGTRYKDIGTINAKDGAKIYNYSKKNGDWVYVDALNGWVHGKYKGYTSIAAFDTGGYTGSWGEEGRWALLHQKELVLNKDDTENLLNTVDMIRQIAKVIDLNAYASAGFGSNGFSIAKGQSGTLEQHVQITAEFPNATNREEIYAAFNDIVNLASQYANR